MARFWWKQGAVVSLSVKNDIRVLAQMLYEPYLMIFHAFSRKGSWNLKALDDAKQLFCCAVTRQFMKCSRVQAEKSIAPANRLDLPTRWIESHHGSRWLTFWKGTPDEVTFCSLEQRPGGRLIEKDIMQGGMRDEPVVIPEISLDDDKTIDGHELAVVWTFPGLNERLFYCYREKKNVDPDKDLKFDRPIAKKYKTMVNLWACRGSLEDWGFSIDKA